MIIYFSAPKLVKKYGIPSKKPLMSTYIVAIVVSDLNISIRDGKNTVWL